MRVVFVAVKTQFTPEGPNNWSPLSATLMKFYAWGFAHSNDEENDMLLNMGFVEAFWFLGFSTPARHDAGSGPGRRGA